MKKVFFREKSRTILNRIKHKGIILLIGILCFGIPACATITQEMVQKNLSVVIPEGAGKFPVVIFYQGTGGE